MTIIYLEIIEQLTEIEKLTKQPQTIKVEVKSKLEALSLLPLYESFFAGKDYIIRLHYCGHQDGVPCEIEEIEPTDQIYSVEKRDTSGKLRVHQTSRALGTTTYFAGASDDTTDVTDVGGGVSGIFKHETGQPKTQLLYMDFNIIENETWIHEGYITWQGAQYDQTSLEVVPRVTSFQFGEGTNYKLYGDYLIIPAEGDGDVEILSDLSDPNGGLIYIPKGDLGNRSTAFWNADWNSDTKKFEHIIPAPFGDGKFNLFVAEVSLTRFVNKLSVLDTGSYALKTSDASELGQGMRVKLSFFTQGEDHVWGSSCTVTLHRARTV